MDLREHQMGEGSIQLILVRGAANRKAGRSLQEALQGALGDTDRHPRHEAERPAARWCLPEWPLKAAVERPASNVTEVDASIISDEELVFRDLDGNTSRRAHAGYLPVVEKSKLVERNLPGDQIGARRKVTDSPFLYWNSPRSLVIPSSSVSDISDR